MKHPRSLKIINLMLCGAFASLATTACSAKSNEGSGTWAVETCGTTADNEAPMVISAVYEGVEGYGVDDLDADKDSFRFRFHTSEGDKSYCMANDGEVYALQNRLKEGSRFALTLGDHATVTDICLETPVAEGRVTAIDTAWIEVDGVRYDFAPYAIFTDICTRPGGSVATTIADIAIADMVKAYGVPVTHVDRAFVASSYTPPVSGEPGKRTLKNFLATALTPLGTTLYVYGGGWNWQDDGADDNTRSIGLPDDWVTFFEMNDADYQYKGVDPVRSYYPWHGYNEYHYAGADCSGFVGWTIYNTFNTGSSVGEGYVMPSTKMAGELAARHGVGEFSKDSDPAHLGVGDIVSIKGHVYIVIGRAADGSLLIIHSSVSDGNGGGVQLSAVGDSSDCEALALARHYMTAYYPEWSSRYEAVLKPASLYLDFSPSSTGRMSWHLSPDVLADPDGYRHKSAAEILNDLFNSVYGN